MPSWSPVILCFCITGPSSKGLIEPKQDLSLPQFLALVMYTCDPQEDQGIRCRCTENQFLHRDNLNKQDSYVLLHSCVSGWIVERSCSIHIHEPRRERREANGPGRGFKGESVIPFIQRIPNSAGARDLYIKWCSIHSYNLHTFSYIL